MRLRSMTSWRMPLAYGTLAGSLLLAACSSKTTSSFGDDMSSGDDASSGSGSGQASGSGSGSGSESGTSSGSGGSGSSSGASSGSHSGSTTGAKDGGGGSPRDAGADGPTVIDCGGDCNLSTNTCCLSQTMQGTCVARSQKCPQFNAAFSCGGAVDCPQGQVCCGVANQALGQAKTTCMASCPTVSPSMTQGQAQVCRGTAECQNGMDCIPQTCLSMANLSLCGLTAQKPFSCVAQ